MKKKLSIISFLGATWATLALAEANQIALSMIPLAWMIFWAVVQLKSPARERRATSGGFSIKNSTTTPIYFKDDYCFWRD